MASTAWNWILPSADFLPRTPPCGKAQGDTVLAESGDAEPLQKEIRERVLITARGQRGGQSGDGFDAGQVEGEELVGPERTDGRDAQGDRQVERRKARQDDRAGSGQPDGAEPPFGGTGARFRSVGRRGAGELGSFIPLQKERADAGGGSIRMRIREPFCHKITG